MLEGLHTKHVVHHVRRHLRHACHVRHHSRHHHAIERLHSLHALYTRAHLLLHVEWVRCYYHFSRKHLSLNRELANGRNRYLTPAVAAGVASRRYEVREILMMSLYTDSE